MTFKMMRGIVNAQLFRPGALSMHDSSFPGALSMLGSFRTWGIVDALSLPPPVHCFSRLFLPRGINNTLSLLPRSIVGTRTFIARGIVGARLFRPRGLIDAVSLTQPGHC